MSGDWKAVDDYIAGNLLGDDPALEAALAANKAGGLPPIDVSATQGKMLHLLARMMGARRILEVGTLGGYSTIWLARALPRDGRLVTLELVPHHAEVARANLANAGVADRCEVRVGPAIDSLAALRAEGAEPFDLVFIDADKPGNVAYVRAALELARPGTAIIVDNVVREGGILDPASTDAAVIGTQRLFEMLADEPRLDATAIQTVGAKKWDGFVLALVR
ncbi:O-methyltransferase [Sphingomonas sp. LB-2]|uniref:O-methyltransferase n=1 Tax=Sphingomonas caeni TaxID=2984949 RepID=UPI00222E2C16|nr:O-methyltransferase [Sphingomonas caeni]MCW3847802.1 O-methyltransferase [Sphingomonas caeni]